MSAPSASPATDPPPGPTRQPEYGSGYVRLISRILFGGVLLSVGILTIGVIDLLVRGTAYLITGSFAYTVPGWLGALGAGEPEAIFLLGLVVLVLTPLTRVLVSIVMFSREGDRAFVAMTLFVLGMLGVSAFVGVGL